MPLFWYLAHSPGFFKTCPAYCTLLCFRKEIIKFSEVFFVSVHLNCLIPSIVIVRGYRPCNTATSTAYICLVVENGNKNTETKCKVCSNIFYQVFGCPKINFGPRTQRQSHSLNVNQSTFKYDPKVGGSQSLTERIIRIRASNLSILSVPCYRIVSLFPKLY